MAHKLSLTLQITSELHIKKRTTADNPHLRELINPQIAHVYD
jgi:hypothetical protein